MTSRRSILSVVCAAAAIIALAPAVQGDWVNWDDPALFLQQSGYRGFAISNLKWMITAMPLGHWAPVTWLTHAVDYRLWGLEASGHHLTSILFHAANAVLFFYVSLALLRLAVPRWSADLAAAGAAAAAIFFAIHPLRVESVAWLTERRDLVSTCFVLLTVYAYTLSVTTDRRTYWFRVAMITYALAALSKTIVMVLPALLLVLDFYPLRRLNRRTLWGAVREKWPFFILGSIAAVMAAYGQREIAVTLQARGLLERLATAAYGAGFYLWKTLWPYPISPLYEIQTGPKPGSLPVFASALAVLAIGVIAYRMRTRWPAVIATFTAYLVCIAPVSGLTQAGPQLVASRYTYLSGLWLALLVGGVLALLLERNRWRPRTTLLAAGILVSYSVLLIMLTREQVRVWRDSGTLWEHTLSLFPDSPIANHNLGLFLWLNGDAARGKAHVSRALEIQPGYLDAMRNLSMIALQGDTLTRLETDLAEKLSRAGQFEFAADIFRRRLELNPRDAVSRNNLGAVYFAKGDTASAIRQFEEALAIQPNYGDARFNLETARAASTRPEP